jgi:protein translocase SEC61 complex gamma subunit
VVGCHWAIVQDTAFHALLKSRESTRLKPYKAVHTRSFSEFRLGARDFFKSAAAIFRLSRKSDRAEFTLYLKLVALGVLVVGTIGFIIKLVGNVFFG